MGAYACKACKLQGPCFLRGMHPKVLVCRPGLPCRTPDYNAETESSMTDRMTDHDVSIIASRSAGHLTSPCRQKHVKELKDIRTALCHLRRES